jgi:hypothetical protein
LAINMNYAIKTDKNFALLVKAHLESSK